MSSIKKVLCASSKRTDLVTTGFIYDVVRPIGGDYLQINGNKGTTLVIGVGDYCNIGEWQPLEEYMCLTGIYQGLKIGDFFFGYKNDGAIIYPQGDGLEVELGDLSKFKKVSEMSVVGEPEIRFEVRHVVYDAKDNKVVNDAMGECYITLAEAQELCDEMNAPKVMKPVFTKEVEYFGVKIMVPENSKYLATNGMGTVYASNKELTASNINDYWCTIGTGNLSLITKVYLNGIDWKETLVEIK